MLSLQDYLVSNAILSTFSVNMPSTLGGGFFSRSRDMGIIKSLEKVTGGYDWIIPKDKAESSNRNLLYRWQQNCFEIELHS